MVEKKIERILPYGQWWWQLHHHSKVAGSNPATTTYTRREKFANKKSALLLQLGPIEGSTEWINKINTRVY
jgi:hypothetical protein